MTKSKSYSSVFPCSTIFLIKLLEDITSTLARSDIESLGSFRELMNDYSDYSC